MVRLLRLVVDYGPEKVANAVRKAEKNSQYSVDVVQFYVNESTAVTQRLQLSNTGPAVQAVDLSAYDALFTEGGLL
jgi:hypothetical protein